MDISLYGAVTGASRVHIYDPATTELVKMGDFESVACKKRSEVWKYFLIDNKSKKKVKCKKSPIIQDFTSCPTNMLRHLQRSHLLLNNV